MHVKIQLLNAALRGSHPLGARSPLKAAEVVREDDVASHELRRQDPIDVSRVQPCYRSGCRECCHSTDRGRKTAPTPCCCLPAQGHRSNLHHPLTRILALGRSTHLSASRASSESFRHGHVNLTHGGDRATICLNFVRALAERGIRVAQTSLSRFFKHHGISRKHEAWRGSELAGRGQD